MKPEVNSGRAIGGSPQIDHTWIMSGSFLFLSLAKGNLYHVCESNKNS